MQAQQTKQSFITEDEFLDLHKKDQIGKPITIKIIHKFIAVKDQLGELLVIYYIHKIYGTEVYDLTTPDYYEELFGKDWKNVIEQSFSTTRK